MTDDAVREEARAAASLGIDAAFTGETSLPFPVKGAVRFNRQAQFHPLRFLEGAARNLTVYEDTRVLKVAGGRIETEQGTVEAKHIVFATHYPFVNFPGYYFLRQHQERSYVIALEGAASWTACTGAPIPVRSPSEMWDPAFCWGERTTAREKTRPVAATGRCGNRGNGSFRRAGKWPTGRPRTA